MLNEKICNDAVGVISFIVEDSDYKNAIVTNTKSGESFDAIEVLENLIKEHFTPKALKFKDLKEGMYVYDKKMNNIVKVERSYINYARELIVAVKTFNYGDADMYYEDNRFYPITIPKVGRD